MTTCEACLKRPAWIGASINGEHFCTQCLITLAIEVDCGTDYPIAVTKALAVSIEDTDPDYDRCITLDKNSITSTFIARDDNGDVQYVSITVVPQNMKKEKEHEKKQKGCTPA